MPSFTSRAHDLTDRIDELLKATQMFSMDDKTYNEIRKLIAIELEVPTPLVDMVLPEDVKVNYVTFGNGVHLTMLLDRMRSWHGQLIDSMSHDETKGQLRQFFTQGGNNDCDSDGA